MAAKKCLICNGTFSGRADARTCSPRCRKRLQLVRLRLQTVTSGTAGHGQVKIADERAAVTRRQRQGKINGWKKGLALILFGLFGILSLVLSAAPQPAVAASTSSDLNFQARLLDKAGAVVPDGNYNIDFKIYNADSTTGTVGSCSGACLWEETRLNSNSQGVAVTNGYFSVNLGSVTTFPAGINWDQQLYLTMNIGGTTAGTPTWDGEMQNAGHSIALTALPYSFVAGQLAKTSGANRGTLSFNTVANNPVITLPDLTGTALVLQGSTPGTVQAGNFNIGGTGIASILQAGTIDAATAAALTIGNTNATAINIGKTASNIATTVNGTLAIKPTTGNDSTTAFQVQTAGGVQVLNVDTTDQAVQIGPVGKVSNAGVLNLYSTSSDAIDIQGEGSQSQVFWKVAGNQSYYDAFLNAARSRGTLASPTALQGGDDIFTFNGVGQYSSTGTIATAQMAFSADGNFSSAATPGRITFSTHSNDSPTTDFNPTERLRIDSSGNVGIGTTQNSVTTSAKLQVVSADVGTALFKVTDATATAADVMTIADGGGTTFKTQTNTANAFQIQDNSNLAYLTVDNLTNKDIQIGSSTPDSTTITLVLDNATADPASGINGAMYYNTTSNVFRCYQNSAWVNCAGSGGGGGITTVGTFSGSSQPNGATISGTTITFGPADATNPGMVSTGSQTFAGAKTFTGDTLVKENSLTAFQVQNASNGSLLSIDSDNANITLNGLNYADIQAWQSTTVLPANIEQSDTVFANGYIYEVGGFMQGIGRLNTVYYAKVNGDGTVGAWKCQGTTASGSCAITPSNGNGLPTTIQSGKGGYINGYIYIVGGLVGGGSTGTNNVYYARVNADGSTGPWLSTTSYPASLFGGAATVVNGYLYYVGGTPQASGNNVNTVYYAKPNANGTLGAWSKASTLPANLNGEQLVVANGYLYALGGSPTYTVSAQTSIYYASINADGSIGAWSTEATNVLPHALVAHTAVFANGYIYVMGGYDGTNGQTAVYYAKPNSNGSMGTWATSSQPLPNRRWLSSPLLINGYIYVIGGYDDVLGNNVNTVYYTSTSRVKVGGSLDLVGNAGQSLTAAGGGNLTAGNTLVAGTLNVDNQANFGAGVGINGGLSVMGGATVQAVPGASSIFQVQNAGGASALTISTVNLVGDANFESGVVGNSPDGWLSKGAATLTLDNSQAEFGANSLKVVTTTAANDGAYYSYNFAASTQYTLSLYAKVASGTITDVDLGHQETGADIVSGCTGKTLTTTWTRFTCTFTTGSTITPGGSNIFVRKTGASAETFYIDGVQLEAGGSASTFRTSDISLNGQVTFKNNVNSTTAFQVQNASGGNLIQVDTANNNVTLNGQNGGETTAWNTTTPFTTATYNEVSLVANGYMYVIAGSLGGGVRSNAVYYAKINAGGSISSGAWQTGNSTGLPQVEAPSGVVLGGYIYIVGGTNSSGNFNTVYYSRINTDGTLSNWQQTASIAAATTGMDGGQQMVAVNGYIYWVSGQNNGNTDIPYVYYAKPAADGSISGWTTSANQVPTNRTGGVVYANGYIYLVGGCGSGCGSPSNTVLYAPVNADGSTGVWQTESQHLPVSVYANGLAAVNGYIYSIGGNTGSATAAVYYAKLNSDGTTGAWQTSAYSLPQTIWLGQTPVANGYIYMIGGYNGSPQNTVYYASTSRVQVAGSLDLVGIGGQTLGTNNSGGSLTAGNTTIAGTLQVAGQAQVAAGLGVGGSISAAGGLSVAGGASVLGSAVFAGGNNQLGPPSGTPTVSFTGTVGGSAVTWSYVVTAVNANGSETTASAVGSIAAPGSSNSTLSSSNYNTVSWSAVTGATSYKVYRTAATGGTPSTTGYIGTTTGTSLNDTGTVSSGTNTNPPTIDTTGQLTVQGSSLFRTTTNTTTAFQVQNASGGSLLAIDSTNVNITLAGLDSGATAAWGTLTSLTAGRSNITAATSNGYIYVLGGDNGGSAQTTIYYARVNSDGTLPAAWTTATNGLPQSRDSGSSVVANGYIYYLGGKHGGSNWNTVYYAKLNQDGSVGTWNCEGASSANCGITPINGNVMPGSRDSGSSVVANGYIYYMGGLSGGASQTTVYYAKLNPDGSTGAWITSGHPLTLGRDHAATVYANGYVYVIGGDQGGTSQNTIYYTALSPTDGSVGSWSSATNTLPLTKDSGSAVVSNGYVYYMGGKHSGSNYDTVNYAKLNTDGSVGTWSCQGTTANCGITATNANALPITLDSGAAVMVNGYIYYLGGVDSSTDQAGVYYASGSRIQIGANLDLVGLQGGNLAQGGNSSSGSAGGSLTAGNGLFVGGLQVQGSASFNQSLAVNGNLTVNSSALFQSATGTSVLAVDTTNQKVSIGSIGTSTGQLYVSGLIPKDVSSGGVATAAGAESVYVQGHYAYVVDYGASKLQVFDVSNPSSPVDLTSGGVNTRNEPNSVYVQGHYAYVVDYGWDVLQIFDVSNPSSPVDVTSGGVNTASQPSSVYVQGRYAYVLSYSSKLQIFDISNPAHPFDVTSGGVATVSGPNSVYVQGKYAYVTGFNSSKLQIFDVSNPSSPVDVTSGGVATANSANYAYVQGNYAYVVDYGANKLQVFNITNPAVPVDISSGGVATVSEPYDVYVQGRYAYVVGDSGAKLQVFDVSDPAVPVDISSGGVATVSGPESIYVQGRYAYVAAYSASKLQVFDLGGAYVQQLEAGGAEVGTLSVDSGASFAGDAGIAGGLQVGQSAQISGNLATSGNLLVQGTTSLAGGILGGTTINSLSTPAAPTVTPGGTTGSTSYSYTVTAISASGGETLASPAGSTATGNATLSSTNYNQLTWTAVNGAVAYKVYRTVGGATQGLIGTAYGPIFYDTGLAGSGSSPTVNTTGNFTVNGSQTLFKPATDNTTAFQVQNAAGGSLLAIDSTNSNITLAGLDSGALGTWQQDTANPLPVALYAPASVVANGYVYSLGGENSSAAAVDTVYYSKLNADGSVGAWQTDTANPLPVPLEEESSVVANGYIYALGGATTGGTAVDTVYYSKLNADGSVGAWQTDTANPLPEPQFMHSSVVANGYVYVIEGGASGDNKIFYAKLNADGSVGAWQTNTNSPSNDTQQQAAVVANGYLYIVGGWTTTFYNNIAYAKLNSDGSIGSFTNIASPFPTGLREPTAVVSNGYLYALGGYNGSYLATVYYGKLNASNGSVGAMTATNSMPTTAYGHTSVVANGYIYEIGGYNGSYLSNVNYVSASRVQIGANLDLLGPQGGNLADDGSGSFGSVGGSIAAGNGTFVGNLQVQGQGSFAQGLATAGNLSVGGQATIQNAVDSTSAFQVQNSSGVSLIGVDTTDGGTITLASGASPYSDEFNTGGTTAGAQWTSYTPTGTSYTVNSGGNGQLVFTTTDTNDHDCWAGELNCTYLAETAPTGSFQVDEKINTTPSTTQAPGMMFYQDSNNFLRFEYEDTGTSPNDVYEIRTDFLSNGVGLPDYIPACLTSTGPMWLRVNKNETTWTYSFSTNGVDYSVCGSFSVGLDLTVSGAFIGPSYNAGSGSATGSFDIDYYRVSGVKPTLKNTGTTLFQPTVDTTTAFQIQNGDTDNVLFDADTTNMRVGIGTSTPSYTLDVAGSLGTQSLNIVQSSTYNNEFSSATNLGWTFTNPLADSSTADTTTSPGELTFTPNPSSGVQRDCWTGGSPSCLRFMENAPSGDFQADTKIDTVPATSEGIGIMVYVDSTHFIRFEWDGGSPNGTLHAYYVNGASGASQESCTGISATAPLYLRVTRTSNTWTIYSSTNGSTFTQCGTGFSATLSLTTIGLYYDLGSTGTFSPASFDYFRVALGSGTSMSVQGNSLLQAAVNTTSTFQVQNSSGTNIFQVDTSTNGGEVFVRIGGQSPSGGQRLCSSFTTDAQTGLTAILDCNNTNSDYAEDYGTTDASIQAGDLVALDTSKPATSYTDSQGNLGSRAWVVKASSGNQSNLLGVVSTQANEIIGQNFLASENPRPVTLSGRVPVKVNTQNGPIEPGDYLVPSSTPGEAMKATGSGWSIGMALSGYDGTGTPSVIVSTGRVWYVPPVVLQNGGNVTNVDELLVNGPLQVNGNAVFEADITIAGHIIGNSDTNGTLTLSAGSTSVSYSFARTYGAVPNVVITPESDPGARYWISKSSGGFTIHLSATAGTDVKFDYIVQQ